MDNSKVNREEKWNDQIGFEQVQENDGMENVQFEPDTLNGNDFLRSLLADEISEGM